jgi:adenylate cyclase class IV
MMAKQTKKAKKRTEPASASHKDFQQARDLLRQRANTLILDLAKRYLASKAEELTTVLDAMDSLGEFARMQRPAVSVTGADEPAGIF